MSRINVLVVGNGTTGLDHDGKHYINNHTGRFLDRIGQKYCVTFVQNSVDYKEHNDLQNFRTDNTNFISKNLSSSKVLKAVQLLLLVARCDFIYIFYPGATGYLAGLFSILFNKKLGLYIRGQNYNFRMFDHLILKRARFILTVSPLFLKDLDRFCKLVKVIAPMISIQRSDIITRRIEVFPSQWNILFVGRVEERKGIYELIDIAKLMQKANIKFVLNVVGGGGLFDKLERQLKEERLQESITLLGQISKKEVLMRLYRDADIFVLPTHDEGFPRVLYEAMATSLPIFTTFVGGIPGRMKDGINCIRIPVKDGLGAFKIISKNLEDIEGLSRVGNGGRKTLEEVLSLYQRESHEVLFTKLIENAAAFR